MSRSCCMPGDVCLGSLLPASGLHEWSCILRPLSERTLWIRFGGVSFLYESWADMLDKNTHARQRMIQESRVVRCWAMQGPGAASTIRAPPLPPPRWSSRSKSSGLLPRRRAAEQGHLHDALGEEVLVTSCPMTLIPRF